MGLNRKSDSGYFSELYLPSDGQDTWSNLQIQVQESNRNGRIRTSSVPDVTSRFRPIDEIMEEFKLNGTDSPYNPEEELMIRNSYRSNYRLNSIPSSGYLRQMSYPAPDATPAVPLPHLEDFHVHSSDDMWPITNIDVPSEEPEVSISDVITEEQLSVLNTLPTTVIYYLLREMERNGVLQDRAFKKNEYVECRFCKNNGEAESYYRSHRLRYRGRLMCPVLRAYRCQRCGAGGDSAHTLKYCPFSSDEERMASTALMRSLRTGKGHRRCNSKAPSIDIAGNYDGMMSNIYRNDAVYYNYEPLDPIWEALEKKLML